jgi:sigma-E factor negative regulatory protein RseC
VIEEQARVAETGDGYAWVEIHRRSACASCQTQDHCGSATLAKFWSGRIVRTRAVSTLSLQPGDEVIVGLADGVLLRGALLAYLLPLALLLAGALLGQAALADAGEELVILSGALGLGLGFLAVRILSRRFRDDARFQPMILRRAGAPVGNMLSTLQ